MRRAERLFRLVDEMRSRRVVRADELASHLEVSTRTIYRDIAHLQASGLPIEGEPGVGYLLRPGFNVPSVTFTHDQVDALALGLSFVSGLDDPALAAAAREVRAKIQASMPDPQERKLADAPVFSLRHAKGAETWGRLLREAIRHRQIVRFHYENGSGDRSERRVRPLVLWSFTEGWMVSAWCELRQGFRTFRLDRMSDLSLTQDRFEHDEARGVSAFLASERCERQAS